ncbi:MAG: hypothetical protein C5S48_01825 [Candidatus Methanogaster sp.]|nr:MAG: hypothetical protein C5S48_01825 [ANME-2 cluster archaeon]
MASTSWDGRKLWLKSQIGIMRINALVWAAAIPLTGVDFWYIFETQERDTRKAVCLWRKLPGWQAFPSGKWHLLLMPTD